MSALQGDERERTRGLAREAVRRLAPQELVLFEETADAYFEDPVRASWKARAEPLGIGIDALAVGSWTLFALPVASSVVGNIVTDRVREVRRGGWWRRRRARARADDGLGGVPADDAVGGPRGVTDNPYAAPNAARSAVREGRGPVDLELLRRLAYDHAVALGLPPDQARLLADAVLGGVVAGWDAGAAGDGDQSGSGGGEDDPS
ncbi:hypothetical protein Shyhy01_19260 [Streptomyces hygroscopicus subsp. hygroscopicus]|nr:hypothetical protein [Streptomyces hygroscopicus]GLX48976.1 hypothetical protein Shyhy01_19260 [Streptomyces hygroscopicus subsp. hygroscopicus]